MISYLKTGTIRIRYHWYLFAGTGATGVTGGKSFVLCLRCNRNYTVSDKKRLFCCRLALLERLYVFVPVKMGKYLQVNYKIYSVIIILFPRYLLRLKIFAILLAVLDDRADRVK